MADTPKNTGWQHRRGGLLTPVRRLISHRLSKPLLRLAHRRDAPLRLFLGVVITAVWLWFGVAAALDYGARVKAQEDAAQAGQLDHPRPHPWLRAFANGVCVIQSGKPCDYDHFDSNNAADTWADTNVFWAQTAFAVLAFITLFFGFWTQFLGAIAHALRAIGEGHVIITGRGIEAETLARNAARTGAIVLIRRDVSSAELDAMAADGVAVVAGPPTDAAVLKAAGVISADRVVAVGDDDAENVGVAASVAKARRRLPDPGDVLVRVESAELRSYLPGRGRLRASDLFSLSEISARLLTLSPRMLEEARKRNQTHVHVGVIGWSSDASEVIARVFRIMWAPPFDAPRVTVFTDDPDAARADFAASYPNAFTEEVWKADIEFVEYNWRGRANPWNPLKAAESTRGPLTALVVAPPPGDDATLACAAALASRATPEGIPIFARENNDGSIGITLADAGDGAEVIAFGAPTEVLSSEALIDRRLDEAALYLHESYLETVVLGQNPKEYEQALRKHADGPTIEAMEQRINAKTLASLRKRLATHLLDSGKLKPNPARPAQAPWSKLPEQYISINRTAADHSIMKMWAMGWTPGPKNKKGSLPEFDASQINEQDSALEHRRWSADLLLSGWRFGARDDIEMTHTDLKPYSAFAPGKELNDAVAKDRDPWLAAPKVASLICPQLFVKRKQT